MKKIMKTVKEEDCLIKEIDEKDLVTIEAGGCFTCFTLKRCVAFTSLYQPICKSVVTYS